MLRLDPHGMLKIDGQKSITLSSTLTSPKTMIELPTKSYVDRLYECSRNRRDLSSVFKDKDNEYDNSKLTILYSVSVNKNPGSDSE